MFSGLTSPIALTIWAQGRGPQPWPRSRFPHSLSWRPFPTFPVILMLASATQNCPQPHFTWTPVVFHLFFQITPSFIVLKILIPLKTASAPLGWKDLNMTCIMQQWLTSTHSILSRVWSCYFQTQTGRMAINNSFRQSARSMGETLGTVFLPWARGS